MLVKEALAFSHCWEIMENEILFVWFLKYIHNNKC